MGDQMKLVIEWKANGGQCSEMVQGTREECEAALRRVAREYGNVLSFTSRYVE